MIVIHAETQMHRSLTKKKIKVSASRRTRDAQSAQINYKCIYERRRDWTGAPAIKDAIWQVHQSAAINHLSLK